MADLLHWQQGVQGLCSFSQDLDAEEVVRLPAAKMEPKGNVCQGASSSIKALEVMIKVCICSIQGHI